MKINASLPYGLWIELLSLAAKTHLRVTRIHRVGNREFRTTLAKHALPLISQSQSGEHK